MLRSRLPAALRRFHRQQRGQVLYLVVGLLLALGGMAALAIDLGSYMADRRDLQNKADAIALAASLELPSASDALAVADQWAVENEIDPSLMMVTIVPQSLPAEPNPKVIVELERDHEFFLAKLVGIGSAEVNVDAAAIKTSAAGGDGTVPLAVTEQALQGVALGDEVVLKYDANQITTGNTGPIRIDGPGSGNCSASDKYCTGVKYGSENIVCASGADPAYCTGVSTVDTEPGNKIGATRTAIEYRLNNTDVHCDQFTEVFEDDPTTDEEGVYRIVEQCNPFLADSYYSSLRVLIVPVIDQLCNGSCTVTITQFALFFLEGFQNPGSCQGNDCEIVGRFVRVHQNVGLLAGTFDPESNNQFVRLVE